MARGSNLRNESSRALRRIFESARDIALCCACSGIVASENLSRMHQQVLENWTQAERREKCERAYDQNCGNEQSREERPGRGECPCSRAAAPLVLYHMVLPFKPANAEPLLPTDEV